jgi:hypothetical protein
MSARDAWSAADDRPIMPSSWRVELRTKSLATGHESNQVSEVAATSAEAAIELASLRSSRAHGRVVTIAVVSCERIR